MGLSKRNKRKHLEKAMGMVPAGSGEPVDYALGGGGRWPPTQLAWMVIGGLVGLSVLLSLLLGGLTVVGVLPALAVYFALNNPRGVVVTTTGVASMSCSFLNGRPNRLLAWDARAALNTEHGSASGYTRIAIGQDAVWVKTRDLTALRAPSPPL